MPRITRHSKAAQKPRETCIPVRRILSEHDLEIFKSSQEKKGILEFIVILSDAVKGIPNDTPCLESPTISKLMDMLQAIDDICGQNLPTSEASSRFGKVEFRDFYDQVAKNAANLILPLISLPEQASNPQISKEYVPELATYLTESWGNRDRIDFGSGHELNFVCFLICLDRLQILDHKDTETAKALVLKVFVKYLKVARRLQFTYWLEPAGSHGVWGLDDYHFLPFLFGASQLSLHRHLRPRSIHEKDILDMYGDKYIYLDAIRLINSVKTNTLRWHSPLLDDISGVKKWSKVHEGMIKMYDAEVLCKLPIAQHIMFGYLLSAPEGLTAPPKAGASVPIIHSYWAECCGIKVPSSIAASESENQGRLRTVPFD